MMAHRKAERKRKEGRLFPSIFDKCNSMWLNLVGDDIRTIKRNADLLLNACKDIGLAVNTGKTKTWK